MAILTIKVYAAGPKAVFGILYKSEYTTIFTNRETHMAYLMEER